MNEIATYSMILSKVGLGTSGTECPTKTTILAIDELITIDNANTYGSKETVRIRDIRKREITSSYVLNVTPTSMAFPATGGTKSYTVESYKNTTIEGQGTVKEDMPWTATISGTGFSNTNSDVTAANNNGAERTGSLLITQAESKKAAQITLKQLSAEISYNYYFSVTPTSMNFSVNGGNQNFTVTSYKKQVINGIEQPREIPVEYSSTISGTGFSVSGTTVIAATNSSGKRTGKVTVTQAESNKVGNIELSQDGVELPWVYTFKISPWESNIGNQGGTTSSFTITSTKTKEGVTQNVDWSIDTTTVPSWVTFNQSNMTFTVAVNNAAARNVNIKFKQAESGNTDIYRINQDGVVVTTSYNLVWADNSGTETRTISAEATSGSSRYEIASYSKKSNSSTLTPHNASISDITADWITATLVGSDVNRILNINYEANSSTSSRTGTITVTQDTSGKQLKVTVSQAGKAEVPWQYTFNVVEDSFDGTYDSATYSSKVTSTKSREGTTEKVQWSIDTTTVPSWITATKVNDTDITFQLAANTQSSARTANIKLIQAESNNEHVVTISQGAKPEDTYVFTANPNSFSFVANGGSGISAVTSTKNGIEQGWSITKVSTDWITATKDSSNVNISVTENYTKSSRTGTITLTQLESNKTATITVNQKVSDEWVYTFEPVGASKDKPTRITTGLSYFGLDTTYTMYSYKQRSLNGIIVDDTQVGVNVTYTVDYPSKHNCTVGTVSADKTKWMLVIQLPYTSANPSLTTEYGTFTATQDSSGNIFKIDFMQVGDTDFRIGTYNLNKTSSSDTKWYGTDLIVYKEGSSDQTNGSQLFLTYVEINIDTDKLAEEGYTLVSRVGTPSADRFIGRFSCPYTLRTTANWFTTRFESEDKYGRLYFIFPENTGSTRNATIALSQNTPSVDITGCEVYENTPQEFNFTVTQNAGN